MEKLWTRTFIFITVGFLFLFVGFYLLLPTLPLFIKGLGGSEAQVGLASGAFMLSAVVFRPFIGVLLDRFGRKPFIVWGLILFIVVMYMYNWVESVGLLVFLRILHGISWAITTTAIFTAVTDIIPTARRGEGLGWFTSAMTIGMAIGPLSGLWIVEHLSYHSLFLFTVCFATVALAFMWIPKFKAPSHPRVGKVELFEKSVLPVTISTLFLTFAYGGVINFVPLFSNAHHINSGTFFLVYAVTLFVVRPVGGKLSDRYGESVVIIPSLIMTIVALITLSFSSHLFGFILSAILYGFGFGIAQPALQVATIQLAPPKRRGIANATLLTATDLGIGLGAVALGWVSEYTTYRMLFIASALSVILSLLFFVFYGKRYLENSEEQTVHPSSLPSET